MFVPHLGQDGSEGFQVTGIRSPIGIIEFLKPSYGKARALACGAFRARPIAKVASGPKSMVIAAAKMARSFATLGQMKLGHEDKGRQARALAAFVLFQGKT